MRERGKRFWNAFCAQMYMLFHKRSFWVTFWIVFLYSVGTYVYLTLRYPLGYLTDPNAGSAWFAGAYIPEYRVQEIYMIVFPVLTVIPFVSSFFEETKKNGTAAFFLMKNEKGTYLFSKACTAFCGNFVIFFVSYASNLLLNEVTYGERYGGRYGEKIDPLYYMNLFEADHIPFVKLYVTHTVLYLFLFCICFAAFAGLLGMFAYACSLWLLEKRIFAFVVVYLFFYLTRHYAELFGNFDLNNAVLLDFIWKKHYGSCLVYFSLGLLAVSVVLIVLRMRKGVEEQLC